jgi:DNA-binding response OmpR family regulator
MSDSEAKYKILITDDDDFLTEMYVAKFAKGGIDVEVCKSGEALIDKLKSGATYDLILLDIIIPNLDGLETLRQVREEKLGEGIPVIMLTNQSEGKDITAAKDLGVQGYIVKSATTPSELVDEIKKILDSFKK